MPTAGFDVRLGVKDAETVRKALEGLGAGGEAALNRLDRAAARANNQGLRAVNTGLREVQLTMAATAGRLGPLGIGMAALGPAGLAAAAATVTLGGALLAVGKNALDVGARFETLRVQLRTVTQSAELADIAFGRIREFARTTPFEVENLVAAFNRLKAAGIDPSNERLRAFGDTAAAFGKDITDFAEAVVGVVTGEAERLKQFGIIARIEGDKVRLNFRGMTREVKRDAESIVEALREIGATEFAGGMAAQARTFTGAVSNMRDAWSDFLDSLAQTGILDRVTAAIRGLTGAIEGLRRGLFPTLGEQAGDILGQQEALRQRLAGSSTTPAGRRARQAAERDLAALNAQLAPINRLLDIQRRREDAAVVAGQLGEQATKEQQEAEALRKKLEFLPRLTAEQQRQVELVKLRREAEEKSLEALRQHETAHSRAALALDEHIRGLETEARLSGLTSEERRTQEELIRAQEIAGRRLTEVEERRLRLAVEQTSAQEKARARAEEFRRELERSIQHSTDRIVDFGADAFDRILSRGRNTWRELFNDLIDIARRAFAQMAAEALLRPIVQPIVASAVGAAPAAFGLAPAAQAAGNLGPAVLGGSRLFGGGGFSLNALGASLGFAPTTVASVTSAGSIGAFTSEAALAGSGLTGAGGLSALTLSSALGAAGLGFLGGSVLGPLVGLNGTGAGLGGGVGALAGLALGGPLGAVAGGLLGGVGGGLIGKLFGPKPSVGPTTAAAFRAGPGGLGAFQFGADNGATLAAARQFGTEVAGTLSALGQALGVEFTRTFVLELSEQKGFAFQQGRSRIRLGTSDLGEAARLIFTDPRLGGLAGISGTGNAALRALLAGGADPQAIIAAAQTVPAEALAAGGSITAFLNAQKLSEASSLSPLERLSEAQRQFDALLGRVQGGELGATGGLTSAAGNLLTIGRQVFGSTDRFGAIERAVQQSLLALGERITSEAAIQDRIVEAIRQQTSVQSGGFAEVAEGLAQLRREFQQLRTSLRVAVAGA